MTTTTTQTTTWILEPRDPLLVRDGRPFGPDPGARALSLPFPFPSTISGGIRTRAGTNGDGIFQYTPNNKEELQHLKKLRVRGPLLAQLAPDGEIAADTWLLPAPQDALVLPSDATETGKAWIQVQRLVPLELPPGAQTDLDQEKLLCVGLPGNKNQGKPLHNSPAYWKWEHFQTWLLDPSRLAAKDLPLSQLGLRELAREYRLHVSIDADKEIAKDGMLFETSGLEFTAPGTGSQRLQGAQRLALVIAVEDSGYTIQPGLASFAGERRLVTWRKSKKELPMLPEGLEQAIVTAEHCSCRLFLLTPACFTQGYRPTWLQAEAARKGVRVEIRAIATQRPQVVSGWDLAEGKPKPSRRLAPAGTVLFLSLTGTEAALREWIRSTWMQCISDMEEDRTDGFGLAVLGMWDGRPVSMEQGEA
jgi:CRISPR-associated protein Cmr3